MRIQLISRHESHVLAITTLTKLVLLVMGNSQTHEVHSIRRVPLPSSTMYPELSALCEPQSCDA